MNEITLGGVKWYMIGENKEFLRTNAYENRISGSVSNTMAQKDNVPSNLSTSVQNEKEKNNNNRERSNRAKRTKDGGQSVSRERERSQEFRDRKWNVKTK